MLSLWIDTHEEKIIIALFLNEKILEQEIVKENIDHSKICLKTLISLMNKVNKKITEIDDIIVVNGPGSFTGVRLGVTIAKTLAYTLNKPIRTITSIETCLASLSLKEDFYLAIAEKNGYFLAYYNSEQNSLENYFYLKKSEYDNFQSQHKVIICNEYELEKALIYAHRKKTINPHQVNPIYIKKIEVEKWLKYPLLKII